MQRRIKPWGNIEGGGVGDKEAFKMEIVPGDCKVGLLSDELKHKVNG